MLEPLAACKSCICIFLDHTPFDIGGARQDVSDILVRKCILRPEVAM
jgi:hypothetical protein